MTYFKHLQLPDTLLKALPSNKELVGDQVPKNPKEFLTDDAYSAFTDIGLEPSIIFFFSRFNESTTPDNRVIHSDLTRADPKPWAQTDDASKKTWKKFFCGVNWEVEDSRTDFSWWNMDAFKPCYPIKQGAYVRYDYLNSVHFIKRGNFGVPEGAIHLDKVIIEKTPILVRTDIPHSAVYTGSKVRLGVSLRFNETWSSWDEGFEKFRPLFKN